jgi:hypothetical protein
MKKFQKMMVVAAACVAISPLLTSCHEDKFDTFESLPVDNSDFPGTYKLTSYSINDDDGNGGYVSISEDLNGDLVESHDLTAESSCYADSFIRFNPDHTYARNYGYFDGTACATPILEVGTWKRSNDTISISSSDTNGTPEGTSMELYSMDFIVSGNTLTGSREGIDYTIGRDYGTGKVDFVYSKDVAARR